MDYQPKHFDPRPRGTEDKQGNVAFHAQRDKPQSLYVFAPKVVLALNVALATHRPLLISGEPGCGKSSLAVSAARVLGWRYYHRTITSRTQASDLLWTFDALRRLNDANVTRDGGALPPMQHYVEPGPLWWAFDPDTARRRGKGEIPASQHATDPAVADGGDRGGDAVVLIDEIDKADPDVPNDLLEPVDTRSFTVRETGDEISAPRRVLMMLTTNRERTLPRAFLRRCVTLELDAPTDAWLADIAVRRYGDKREARYREIAREVMALRSEARKNGIREPSTAEYLDTIVAVDSLEPKLGAEVWNDVKRALLWKSDLPFSDKANAAAGAQGSA